MAQCPSEEEVTLDCALGSFVLKECVAYPNGGKSSFYVCGRRALIVDDDIWVRGVGEDIFDYSLITNKQNAYVSAYDCVLRVLREDLAQLDGFVADPVDAEYAGAGRKAVSDRADQANVSVLEAAFEEHFTNVYGADSARFLMREYAIEDMDGHTRFIDYVVRTRSGLLGVEENGVSFHHPQIIGKARYRKQLLKQNSCQLQGIRLFRFSSQDCSFAERLEDDIRTYFGATSDDFIDAGLPVERKMELYQHQEGALEEMRARREQGTKCFLAVLPTASGKSQIALEDMARFAPGCARFRALIAAPNKAICHDWRKRVTDSLPRYAKDVVVCTYAYITRHYCEYAPDHFSYIVIDEAHHAVAPALKRTIQYFDPEFLVGLTATDERPDRQRLESVFGTYRTSLTLAEAMDSGIVATARAFRIETNIDLAHVRINGKDYVNADLERCVRVTSRNELIVDVLRTYFCEGGLARRQGVIFCVNVSHAKEMARLLNEAGISARELSGRTARPEAVMADFRRHRTRFLCSCQMISEGWDYPELGILVMARPTLSRVLYLQQLGRGLRRTRTKRDVYVIDVVDEYGYAVVPCSLHSVFHNPYYVPFGEINRRDYKPGELIEVDGLCERVERIVEVDAVSYAEKYAGYLSVEQVAREFFVNTGTIKSWMSKHRLEPTVSFTFGSRPYHLFSPKDVEAARTRLGLSVHDDTTILDDFLAFLEQRDYSLSYKMPFLISFIDHMDRTTGDADINAVLDSYRDFYLKRIRQGLVVDRASCPYTEDYLNNRSLLKRSMLTNPFEKFERKRFLYHSRDLNLISMNHALLTRLGEQDLRAIREQMEKDLDDYYARL